MRHTGILILGLLAVGGCAELPARDRAAPAHDIAITSIDFSFVAPDTVAAGLTRIRLSNRGKEHHHAQLARLHPGHTVAELRDTLAAGVLPGWVTFVGGPGVPAPSRPSEVVLSLEAGWYAILCFVESGDRVPHLAKGMIRELVVVAGKGFEGARAPGGRTDGARGLRLRGDTEPHGRASNHQGGEPRVRSCTKWTSSAFSRARPRPTCSPGSRPRMARHRASPSAAPPLSRPGK